MVEETVAAGLNSQRCSANVRLRKRIHVGAEFRKGVRALAAELLLGAPGNPYDPVVVRFFNLVVRDFEIEGEKIEQIFVKALAVEHLIDEATVLLGTIFRESARHGEAADSTGLDVLVEEQNQRVLDHFGFRGRFGRIGF